jgi:hypothetical protein
MYAGCGFVNGLPAGVRFQLRVGVNSRVGVKEEVRSRSELHILKGAQHIREVGRIPEAPLVGAQHIREVGRIPEAPLVGAQHIREVSRIPEAEDSTPHLENTCEHKGRDGNLADKHMVLRTRSGRAR